MSLSKKQSVGEEIANFASHAAGGLFGIAGLVLLLVKSDGPGEIFGSLLFGIGMIMMYTMSSIYHAFPEGGAVKKFFNVSTISRFTS